MMADPSDNFNDFRAGRNAGSFLNETSTLNASSRGDGFRDLSKRNCCYSFWAWAKDGFTIITTCFIVLTVAITVALGFQLQFGSPQVTPEGAVASDSGDCSKDAGLMMLKERGSAVDAAIAAILCVSVSHPHLVGVGGGGVMLIHDHLQMKTSVIDFMPDIPEKYNPRGISSKIGGVNIAIPGFLQGLKYAHKKYGKLTWEELFDPAVKKAKNGFAVSKSLEAAIARVRIDEIPAVSSSSLLPSSSPFSAFFFPNGKRLSAGQQVKREAYAELLQKVALYGPKAVFDTDYSLEVVKLLRLSGSDISVHELQNYKVQEYPTIQAHYRNHTIHTVPQPFGGPHLLSALNLMDNTEVDSSTSLPVLYKHMVEAVNVTAPAFYSMATDPEKRADITEKLFRLTSDISLHTLYPDSTEDYIETDVSPSELKSIKKLRQLNAEITPGYMQSLGNSDQIASQVSVMDTYDLYVAVVAGLGSPLGSQLMTEHGIVFNNLLADVPVIASRQKREEKENSPYLERIKRQVISNETDIEEEEILNNGTSVPQYEQVLDPPRKGRVRPLVGYTPFIVMDKHHVCGWRVVGSSASVSDSLQVLSQHLFADQPITFAVTQPRLAIDYSQQNLVRVHDLADSPRLPGPVRDYLNTRGYQMRLLEQPYSSVNSVAKLRDTLTSHSDTRGGGVAARIGGEGEGEKENSSPLRKEKEEKNDDLTAPVVAGDSEFMITSSTSSPGGGENKEAEDAFTELEAGGPDGTGKVVKGDIRGGGSAAPQQFPHRQGVVNGGRGGGGLPPTQGEVGVPLPPPRVPPVFIPRYPSQVRQDGFSPGAPYEEVPIHIFNQPGTIIRQRFPGGNPSGGAPPPPPPPLLRPLPAVGAPVPGLRGVLPTNAIVYKDGNPIINNPSYLNRYNPIQQG